MKEIFTFLAFILAVVAIYSNYNNIRLHFFSKPATTITIILIALLSSQIPFNIYSILIIIGLVLSLTGDIFLMFEEKYFLLGLISFLIAHIFYIFAFSSITGLDATPFIFIPLIVITGISAKILAQKAGKMKFPVFVYILVISLMLWRGLELYHTLADNASLFAAIGATLFAISDFILGYNKFRNPVPWARVYILSTYYLAQYFISSSIIGNY